MSDKFLIGTKFYRFPDKSETPDIIRLKKQVNDTLFFDDGGYTTTLTNEEFQNMLFADSLSHSRERNYVRVFDYFGTEIKQIWEMDVNSTSEDQFVKFKVRNIGVKMSVRELKENFVRLVPDGFFTISNVDYPINNGTERGFDVLCTLNLTNDGMPYVVCRQDTIDVFKFTNDATYPYWIKCV